MPRPALSLFGFLQPSEALQYLSATCAMEADADLERCYEEARERLGEPLANAGQPDILRLPSDFDGYLAELSSKEWFRRAAGPEKWEFALVQIEPLLAFQFAVDIGRSDSLTEPITTDRDQALNQLVAACLPQEPEQPPLSVSIDAPVGGGPGTVVVTSPSLNLRMLGAGNFGSVGGDYDIIGAAVGSAIPTVQVAKYRGRYYLRNGYHRAYGAGIRGFTHIPCVLFELDEFAAVNGGGLTFSQELLESENPPTLGHFIQDRAFELPHRQFTRVITVSWSSHVIPEA